jgi:hypothetical protein
MIPPQVDQNLTFERIVIVMLIVIVFCMLYLMWVQGTYFKTVSEELINLRIMSEQNYHYYQTLKELPLH